MLYSLFGRHRTIKKSRQNTIIKPITRDRVFVEGPDIAEGKNKTGNRSGRKI